MNKKTIKNKIKSTQSIKKITRTMEMVSVAKMKKALNIAEAYKTFGIEAKNILNILASQREKNVYTIDKESEVKMLVFIAGQKGLCGGYNSNIYRKILRDYKIEADNNNLRFICIGKYAEKIARRFDAKEGVDKNSDYKKDKKVNNASVLIEKNKDSKTLNSNIILSFIGKDFTPAEARILTKNITESFAEEKYKSVDLIYTDFENINTQVVTIETLLPFKNKKANIVEALEYTFEPNVEAVFESTLKVLIQNIILGSVLRARAAEHAARMLAMKTATDSASEMIGELKLWYNKARQAAITQEIAEISSAAMAMQEK